MLGIRQNNIDIKRNGKILDFKKYTFRFLGE
jgi:hypothetical protein